MSHNADKLLRFQPDFVNDVLWTKPPHAWAICCYLKLYPLSTLCDSAFEFLALQLCVHSHKCSPSA